MRTDENLSRQSFRFSSEWKRSGAGQLTPEIDTRLAGVDLTAAYTMGEQITSSANGTWAVGAGYTAGALSLGGYVQQMKNLAGTETRKIIGAGGNFKFNNTFALFGGVMQRTTAVSPQENLAFTLGQPHAERGAL